MVSALKHEGERLYAIARRGETVEREARPVRVAAWRWLEFARDEARFEVVCSGGTYVRTLVHDLGERLGCGAALAELRRLRSEPFSVERACAWRDLDECPAGELLARWGVPLDRALETLPAVVLGRVQAEGVGLGQSPRVEPGPAPVGQGPRSVVFRDADGRALALGELVQEGDGVRARPAVVFPWAVRQGGARSGQ
jgi:tRNA pseudouridine55 synthase